MNKKSILVIGIVAFSILLLFGCTQSPNSPNSNTNGSVKVENGEVKIPLSEVTQTAKFYEFESNGTKIKYFAVKASDGSIKTAFDACDVCYSKKKGYTQEGNLMKCNNCGKTFAIDALGKENITGKGCWPGYLPNTTNGDSIVLKVSDIESGKFRFE
jgi:uncharacterized membrane protein